MSTDVNRLLGGFVKKVSRNVPFGDMSDCASPLLNGAGGRVVLHQVTGDILLSKAAANAHGVGPHDNFAQGPALSLREQWKLRIDGIAAQSTMHVKAAAQSAFAPPASQENESCQMQCSVFVDPIY